MKKSKIFAALALSACVALGATGLAACTGTVGEPGKSAYDIAVEHGFEGTEAEWLESLKGESVKGDKGDDAVAPEIKIGENGNWFINGVDTGIKAQGENGANGTNGTNGTNGENGKDGAGWLVGETEPAAEEGKDGDLYLDYTTWNVYHKQSGAWVLLGNIKGADGEGGSEQEPEEVFSAEISIAANSTYNMPISGITAGVHIIEADLGEAKLTTGRLQAKIGAEGTLSELVYSETRSKEGHQVYYGYIQVTADDTAITFSAIGEAVEATVVIKNWEMPTLSANGNPVEMPINIYGTVDANLIKIKLDSSLLAGSYTLVISSNLTSNGSVFFYVGSRKVTTITAANYKGRAIEITEEDFTVGGDIYIYLIISASNDQYKQINPVTVTLTATQS